jgi:Subtilase family/Fibronectin type-III domain/PA domain/Peptidase inhibitor I9
VCGPAIPAFGLEELVKNTRIPGQRSPALLAAAIVVAATTPLAFSGLGTADAVPAPTVGKSKLYIVQVSGDPVASYDGGLAGLRATSPADGKKVNADSPAVREYSRYLSTRHDQTLARAGIDADQVKVEYSVAFNGFAATLTPSEANRLSRTTGVLRVWANEIVEADTTSTPAFLGLSGAGGTWATEFGGPERAGEGVIVGVIDSGFWPEVGSFAPLPEPRPDAADIAAQWHGSCDVGVESPVSCNNKVLGARYYNASGLAQDYEFLSPRDFNGHGSHTASTSAGNNNVPAVINGLPVGSASGMAPAARLAVYKALWHDEAAANASGGTVDLVAAIDDAVADGVDVINYSIAGSRTSVVDPVEIAFLNAAAANVFVATSAGNNGVAIGASSVAHNSPWTTTVAASTHDRGAAKTVTLGNGATYSGVGVGPAVPSSPLIDSENAGLPNVDPLEAELCFVGTLDPAKVTGKIVLCTRGVNARTDKSLAVRDAGGVGMILFNPTPNSLNADYHFVPSIHIDQVAGAAVKEYASTTASPTASMAASTPVTLRAPDMSATSSFGPALAGGGDLLKPDITAPGVDVIAAVAPPGHSGNIFNAISGTSMSTPHIAGIAALIRSDKPSWSPVWIKSALMTNATPLDNTGAAIQRGGQNATPLDYGSGHVRPGLAFDPGLVYDASVNDWLKYACGIGQLQLVTPAAVCVGVGSIDPSDLNYPSIAIGDLAGKQTVKRTFTNTNTKASQYRVTIQAPPGFTVKVSKAKITVPPLKSRTYSVTVTRTNAALGQWGFGSLTWTDNRGHSVRSPLAVRAVALAAPPAIALTGTGGTRSVPVTPGYTGTLTTSVAGLVPATVSPMTLDTTGPAFNPAAPAVSSQTGRVTVDVPTGSLIARFATFGADYPAGTDVDIFVYRAGTSQLVASSAGSTAEEVVTLNSPAAGSYDLYVDLFAAAAGTTTAEIKPNHWVLGSAAAGNLTASPASRSVSTGTPVTITVNWSGLTPGGRYLGALNYSDGASNIGRTLVTVS